MITEAQKKQLLEQFQRYLDQNTVESVLNSDAINSSNLLNDLSGLKSAITAESSHFKQSLETIHSALLTVQEDNKVLAATLNTSTEQLKQQHEEIIRNMLLELIEIYDRLSSGMQILQNYKPVKSIFKNSRKKDISFIKGFNQGQSMTIRRFEQLFHRYQLSKVDCVGKVLDPETMIAVEIASVKNIEKGMVLEELRPGFLYQNQVLRLAEVKVNRI